MTELTKTTIEVMKSVAIGVYVLAVFLILEWLLTRMSGTGGIVMLTMLVVGVAFVIGESIRNRREK